MRVLYVSTLDKGGPVSHLVDLAPGIAALGIDVLVASTSSGVCRQLRARGVPTRLLRVERKLDARAIADLASWAGRFDVVHTQDRRAGLIGRVAARLVSRPGVHTFHGLPEEIAARVGAHGGSAASSVSGPRLFWLLHGYLRIEAALSRLGAVIVPSHAMARFLVTHGLRATRVHVVPSGIPAASGKPPVSSSVSKPVVGVAANLEHWKGVDVLLEACALTRRQLRVEVYGDGTLRNDLRAQACRLGLDVQFYGHVPDVRDRMRHMDVFVLPSRAENFPIALLEAMASGVPVVATSVGGVPEMLVEDCGSLVPPDDAQRMATAIGFLLDDSERRRAMGRRGAHRVASEYTVERASTATAKVYEALCE